MQKMILIVAAMVLAIPALAQVSNNTFIFVATAPSGACTAGTPGRLVIVPGTLYTCQNDTWGSAGGSGGSGTVTSVSVTTANGISGTVATSTTTPAITLTLGAITPTLVTIHPASANQGLTVFGSGSDSALFAILADDGAGSFKLNSGVSSFQIVSGGTLIMDSAVGSAVYIARQHAAAVNIALAGQLTTIGGTLDLAGIPGYGTAGVVLADAGGNLSQSLTLPAGTLSATINTSTNCNSSASPAVCGSAAAGSVLIPTGTTSSTLTVNTSAVTANSQIVFYPDDSLGTRLSTTCNSTLATLVGGSFISARTPGTSFTITFNGTIVTNGVCGSYTIIN